MIDRWIDRYLSLWVEKQQDCSEQEVILTATMGSRTQLQTV